MAPATHTMSIIMVRSESISGGAIAGAVVGAVFGAALLALVLGFVYFRIKRKVRESEAEAAKLSAAEQDGTTERRASHSVHHFSAEQYPSYLTDEQNAKDTNAPSTNAPSTGEGVTSFPTASAAQTAAQHATDPASLTSQSAPRESASPDSCESPTDRHLEDSVPEHQPIDEPINHEAANASYYDTRISLDSEPAAPGPGSPDRQMSRMYEAQIKESRALAQKKNSGGSIKRFWDTLAKGRRSTQSSMDGSRGVDSPAYTANGGGSRVPTGQWEAPGPSGTQNLQFPGSREIFDEPEEMGESIRPSGLGFTPSPTTGRSPMGVNPQTRAKRMGTEAQQLARINSWRKEASIRESTEVDPELPSAVYGSRFGSSDSYYGGGFPHGAAPPAAQPPHPDQAPQQLPPVDDAAEHPSRLKSPEIPEPVYDDQANAQYYMPLTVATSPHADPSPSPPLANESFVRPMHVMQPTTSTEKYYHTDYRLENPISPVEAGPVLSSPSITDMDMHQMSMDNNYMLSSEHHGMDLMDEFLDIPAGYDEPRRSSESYDYSVSMGPSSTDPSSGRTPDTRITMSPSPFPMHFQPNMQHPEHASSLSPEASKLSPHLSPGSGTSGGNLMCEECGRTFDQIHKLNHHKRYHDRKHECPYQGCDKKFGTKTHLDRHINDKHLKSKAFHCTEPGCAYFKGGKAFPRKDNWRRHMVKKHGANQQTFDAMDEGTDWPMQ